LNRIKTIIDLKGTCQSVVKWRLTDACNYRCSYCLRSCTSQQSQDISLAQQDYKIALESAPDIARIINEMPGKVKLDLIGGEVSLFDLHTILDIIFKITGNKLFRVNITTNMSGSVEYYNDLCNLVYSYGSQLGITCSFHSEFISLENFMSKFKNIKSPTHQQGIRAELVSTKDNQELVNKFIEICEAEGFNYFVERDLTAAPEEKETLRVASSKKKTNRYKVITHIGDEMLFATRNEVISGELADYKGYLNFLGYYCSRDYDFVYIEKNYQIGRQGEGNCKNRQLVSNYHPLKEPKICQHHGCTLCGHISVSRDKEDLI